ncbi:GNAT family N-acetyltransferase [Rubrobacter indicoceani]|uniref:GNAT family N-acetyltransferase n=1 Tax=Rubrobacter indicoceani TaxID=2051957 RepID=UPI000E5AD4E5|nr:GNAT family N-acetyltransferase [Rubrobacter indicoceani]
MIEADDGSRIEVRPGRREDAPQAARLWLESAREHAAYDAVYEPSLDAEKMMRNFLADLSSGGHTFLFVACVPDSERDGTERVVGFVSGELREGSPTFRPRSWASVDDVYVTPAYRSFGIGMNLMHRVRNWALERGTSGVSLQVATGNRRAQDFYRKLDFRAVSIYEVLEFSAPEDA